MGLLALLVTYNEMIWSQRFPGLVFVCHVMALYAERREKRRQMAGGCMYERCISHHPNIFPQTKNRILQHINSTTNRNKQKYVDTQHMSHNPAQSRFSNAKPTI